MLKPPISFKKIKKIIDFAYRAIIKEANFYPCLGLVSKKNNGIHKDMDINDFYLSAKVFKPYFLAIYSNYEDINQFNDLQKIGLFYENRMFEVTNNKNTHKGLIFHFGIIFYNLLTILFKKKSFSYLKNQIKKFCNPLRSLNKTNLSTIDEINYQKTKKWIGARLIAIRGYTPIFEVLNYWKLLPKMINRKKYFMTLLFLFVKIKDTTILKKISLSKYRKAKQYIKKQFLSIEKDYSWKKIYKLNNWALENNISPGGCADLLVIAIFFDLLLKNQMLL